MKRKISYVLVFFIGLFLCLNTVSASSSIGVKASKSSVIVGNTVNVTVTYYSSNLIAQAYGTVTYDTSVLKLTSGNLSISYSVGDTPGTSKTFSYTFKAVGSGTTKVSVSGGQIYELNSASTSAVTPTPSGASVVVITQAQLETTYSKNNYLSSLSVEGYNISFNKDTLSYSLEVENGIDKVNILAAKEDSTASVTGSGEVTLSEGINTINVVVTAQNGTTKTYVLNITRKELNPINVSIDNKNYTLVRKAEFLPDTSIYYTESTVTIDGEEVPCYYNDTTKMSLVGLKDEIGTIHLYSYDNGNYKIYNELNFDQLIIYILEDTVNPPEGYTETPLYIGEENISSYSNGTNFPLIYGMNVETGEKGFYRYDKDENSIQRYEKEKNNEQTYLYVIYGLSGLLLISYIIFFITKKRTPKVKKQVVENKNEVIEDRKSEILKTMTIDIGGIKAEVKDNSKNKKKLEKEEKKKQKEQEEEKRLMAKALEYEKEKIMKQKLIEDKKRMEEELKLRKMEAKKAKKEKNDFSDMAKF